MGVFGALTAGVISAVPLYFLADLVQILCAFSKQIPLERFKEVHCCLLYLGKFGFWNDTSTGCEIPLHALDQHLHNAITWVRNVGKAVQWRAAGRCIDGRIDELNLYIK